MDTQRTPKLNADRLAASCLAPGQNRVMRLDRMGSFFSSRLSFMRALLRIVARDQLAVRLSGVRAG